MWRWSVTYRFRGISLSDRGIAVQGGFDLAFDNGFYAGTWASSIEPVGNSEIEALISMPVTGFEAGGFAIECRRRWSTPIPVATDVHYWGSSTGRPGLRQACWNQTLGAAYAPRSGQYRQ